jgi:hypothetical protein
VNAYTLALVADGVATGVLLIVAALVLCGLLLLWLSEVRK